MNISGILLLLFLVIEAVLTVLQKGVFWEGGGRKLSNYGVILLEVKRQQISFQHPVL